MICRVYSFGSFAAVSREQGNVKEHAMHATLGFRAWTKMEPKVLLGSYRGFASSIPK